MSSQAITLTGDASLGTVAKLLFQQKIKRVPVVENDRLVGLIGRADLLRAIMNTRSDTVAAEEEAMERAIKAHLSSDLGVDLNTGSVHGGCIYLDGDVSGDLGKTGNPGRRRKFQGESRLTTIRLFDLLPVDEELPRSRYVTF